jgi:4-carboxymuconolactone decarboxylase
MTEPIHPTPPATRSPGEIARREVMGDAFVDRAQAAADAFSAPLQALVQEHAWGATWQRDDLTRRQRSLCTVAMLAALGHLQELKGHLQGALNNGATLTEIRGVLLHVGPYAGMPAAVAAFRAAREWMSEQGLRFVDETPAEGPAAP